MIKKFEDKNIHKLARAFSSVETPEECLKFLADLCTVSEVKAMAQRLEVASMLNEHKLYSDIVSKTGASTATISRVNRCLSHGAGGYPLLLDRMEKNHKE